MHDRSPQEHDWELLNRYGVKQLESCAHIATVDFARLLAGLAISRLQEIDILTKEKDVLMYEITEGDLVKDSLTGFYRRDLFDLDLPVTHSLFRQHGRPYGIMVFDLDGLKQINDRFYHSAGDKYILTFSGALTAALRSDDRAYRLGGDEFGVLVNVQDEKEMEQVYQRLRPEVEAALEAYSEEIGVPSIGVSGGFASVREGDTHKDVLERADQAMYAAKRKKKP